MTVLVPKYLRLDNLEPSPMSSQEARQFVRQAVERYWAMVSGDYGDQLLSVEDATAKSLEEHRLLLINQEYLCAYYLGSEWFARGCVVMEEYLIRVRKGSSRLVDVFQAMKVLARLHGAREIHLSPRESPALQRLYARCGAIETTTTMRINTCLKQ